VLDEDLYLEVIIQFYENLLDEVLTEVEILLFELMHFELEIIE
jgi:hypothetical protein